MQLIYAHHVLTGTATFEIEPPSLEEMTQRWSDIVSNNWPFVVASPPSDMSRVLGFAYAKPYHHRAAYAHTFETSVYAAHTTLRQGAGATMLSDVLTTLRGDGVREAVALIGDSANAASIGLHQKMGYAYIGTLTQVGEKFGRMLDVVIMQRSMRAAKASSTSS